MSKTPKPISAAHKSLKKAAREGFPSVAAWLLAQHPDDGLLARISQKLTRRQQEVLWAFLTEQDDEKLADLLEIQPQSVRNHLAEIESRLDLRPRHTLASQVLLALWRESRNLANS